MTEHQFWHGDIRLLQVYQKAYIRNTSYTAWVQGQYIMASVEKGARNALATKSSDIDRKWFDWNDPIEKLYKKKEKPKENNQEHHQQELWFFDTFIKK